MTRLAVSTLIAASLLGVGSVLTGCASGAHGGRPSRTTAAYHSTRVPTGARSGYSVAAVKAAFSAQGVDLRPFQSSGGKPAGAKWVTLIGKWPHRIHVNVRLGPYRGRYNHLTYAPSAVGSDRAQYRNVLIAWRPRDWAVVRGALHRLNEIGRGTAALGWASVPE